MIAVAVLMSSPFLCPNYNHDLPSTGTPLATALGQQERKDGDAQELGLRKPGPGAEASVGEQTPLLVRWHRRAQLPAGKG